MIFTGVQTRNFRYKQVSFYIVEQFPFFSDSKLSMPYQKGNCPVA